MIDYLYLNNTFGFEDIKGIIFREQNGKLFENIISLNRSLAYVVSSPFWELSNISNCFYILKDFNLESSYLRHVFPLFSIYKQRFNRYVEVVKETGLYNFWKSNYKFEMSAFEKRNFLLLIKVESNSESNLRVLNLNYFKYPLIFWFIGCFSGIFVFLLEIFCIKFGFKNKYFCW